ncbi:SRPBCC family protein [Flavobacterium sp. MFBS3-15]|uniref:SRPBCC family protein n=1 Tax=Flavobacterium sp. MFBS3-15 TaxID=2989816 RepID=UPI002235A280|nr:SRPBCC family protein [Flavobacterium sp. MFBS3-15]MCW4469447.1 SRPBCC family protein [Flavobacterium sp. MFBS3-15]
METAIIIIALFVPKEYSVRNEIVINAPKQEVFDYIKMVKNQDHYSKWVMTDPNMKKTFTGTDGTVGFIYAWNGNKQAGAGEQEITGLAEGERTTTEIRFERPFRAIGHTYMATEAASAHSTRVTWGFTGKINYPFNLMTTMMKGTLTKDLGISLNNLKQIIENKQ